MVPGLEIPTHQRAAGPRSAPQQRTRDRDHHDRHQRHAIQLLERNAKRRTIECASTTPRASPASGKLATAPPSVERPSPSACSATASPSPGTPLGRPLTSTAPANTPRGTGQNATPPCPTSSPASAASSSEPNFSDYTTTTPNTNKTPRWATSIGLIARATSLHPPGAPEVDASRQPARHDRALSNSVATPGQPAVPDEAVGACSRACRTSKPVPRSSDAAARRATVSDPDVALLSSPRRDRPERGDPTSASPRKRSRLQ